jgi:hypothetical protein
MIAQPRTSLEVKTVHRRHILYALPGPDQLSPVSVNHDLSGTGLVLYSEART